MRSGIFVVAACVLSACGTAPHIACPALIAYEPGFSTRLAAEIADLPAESAVLRAVRDYISLRDQVRACRGLD